MQKKLFPLFIIVLIALGGLYYYQHYVAAPTIKFNELKLKTTDGTTFDFYSLKGKKTIVFMYASWCGECRKEQAAVSKILEQLSGVTIICISDEPMEKVIDFSQKMQYPFTYVKMEQGFNSIGIYSIPVTYFVNTNLEVVDEKLGFIQWDDPATVKYLKGLL